MPTAPGVCVYVCVCPLLQVCVHLDGSNAENNISLLVILCIIMYVKKNNKKKNSKPIFFFTKPITDYGKMLKYREKYRSTDISVDLYSIPECNTSVSIP